MRKEKYIVFKAYRQEFWNCSIMTALIPQVESTDNGLATLDAHNTAVESFGRMPRRRYAKCSISGYRSAGTGATQHTLIACHLVNGGGLPS